MISTVPMKSSISRTLFLGMQAFGLVMGLVFPLYAGFFMTYRDGLRVFFDIGCIAAGLLVGVFSYVLVERIVFRQVASISVRLKDMAEGHGDLSGDITLQSNDCIGELAANFNAFTESLRTIVNTILQESTRGQNRFDQLSSATAHIAELSKTVAGGLTVVASAGETSTANVDYISRHIEEMTKAISTIAQGVDGIGEAISKISETCEAQRMLASEANQQASEAKKRIDNLNHVAKEIVAITELIGSIADRTNLLALNARIEAATAGEAGRGFAVVASEVKELALQTSKATNDISAKVESIKTTSADSAALIDTLSGLNAQLSTMSQSVASSVEQQGDTVNELAGTIAGSTRATRDISIRIQEASDGLNEVASNICHITADVASCDEGIQSIASQTRASVESLVKLRESVTSFKTR